MPDPIADLLAEVGACPDCDSEAALTEVALGVYDLEIRHDLTCPSARSAP